MIHFICNSFRDYSSKINSNNLLWAATAITGIVAGWAFASYLNHYQRLNISNWQRNMVETWEASSVEDFRKKVAEGVKLGCLNTPFRRRGRGDPNSIMNQIAKLAPNGIGEKTQILIDDGADLSQKDTEGNTPLHWAIANAKNEFAYDVIQRGRGNSYLNIISRVDGARENYGTAPIHLAIAKGYEDYDFDKNRLTRTNHQLVVAMINKGCDVNICDLSGNTPLHIACIGRRVKMIESLLRANANPRIENNLGQRPAELLELRFDEARQKLDELVKVYYLDRQTFEANLEPFKRLFPL